MKFGILSLFAAAVVALTGCRSDLYYQNQAVEEARNYLLENAPELDIAQREFVRFNSPVFLFEPENNASGGDLVYQSGQICVTWIIPGKEDVYMVVGFSDSRMVGWSPNRLVRKQFPQKDVIVSNAVNAARNYVYQNLYTNLPVDMANQIRFTPPEIFYSSFKPETPFGATREEKELILKQLNSKTQFAMRWTWPDNSGNYVVVIGYAPQGRGVEGFAVNSAGIYSAGELSGFIGEKFSNGDE
ncbi:MAG: hypothetical protein ACI4OV_01555 [Victivallaceae bacterium]